MIKLLMKILPMVSCKEASRLMSQRMDRRLTLIEGLKLEMHLGVCGACKQVLKQFIGIRTLLRLYKHRLTNQPATCARLDDSAKAKIQAILTKS